MEDLSSLLNTARELTSHVARSDLPPVNLSLEQIEAQSRRLGRQQAHTPDNGKGSYLLAKANVDAPALASSIATLNTANTFLPLNPLNDTDVSGYLKHAYEQTLISTIEEGRRQTEQEFYQNLELRARKDWEARKKRIFEELGGRARFAGQHAGMRSKKLFGASYVAPPAQSITMNTKFMAYLRVVSELNSHRLASTSYPLLANLSEAARAISEDALRITHTYDILTSITGERPKLPPSHTQAHILNSAVLERAYARAYLGSQESQEALELRKRIAEGSRRALEFQYWEIVERTIQQNPIDAGLGGDPSPANKTRAFLNVQFYKNGAWDSRISLLAGKPLWAILYYLVRTGHLKEAIESASQHATILNSQEELFTTLLQTWAESPDRRLPLNLRERLLANYNSHVLHARDVDPFKLALIKLIGRIDPQRRNIPLVIASTEDWAWFQLAMASFRYRFRIDEEAVSLKDFAQSLLTYKKSHFEPEGKPRRGIWACLLLICGLFEQAVAALYEIPELQVEAVHLAISLSYYGLLRVPSKAESSDVEILITSPVRPAMLNLALLVSRYIRQFQRTDPKEALQYVYCITLNSDKSSSLAPKQNPSSREQVEIARQLVQRVILGCDGKWDDLVGAFREDGTKIPGILERSLPLLHLGSLAEYHEAVLLPAADECEQEGKLVDAIKLYNIAGAHDTVIACLTRALGNVLSEPMGGEGDSLESLTRNILDHYSRRGDAIGPKRQDLMCLLKVREAGVAYDDKQYETALAAIEASGLIPFDGDVQAITRKADSFKENDEAITMNLSHILLLAMNILHGLHGKVKHAMHGDNSRTAALAEIRRKSRALMMFASMQRYRMSADVYGQLTRLDVAVAH
ncbi:nucleoporin-interacting protein NIC96 [Cantharellus anzutake]|uniref:nucleoporin-interacting protein NIC96 n=1 Tax=Cantharellus anzutake TaxID=1750568 RepID=UPI001903D106|nr:nucleoporin-interacting protein NIC96 [Cantharellus anzutake]KAF8323007.1 nucleoporin-interacting protein NIC96 [Cantharellus anzutake]